MCEDIVIVLCEGSDSISRSPAVPYILKKVMSVFAMTMLFLARVLFWTWVKTEHLIWNVEVGGRFRTLILW